MCREGKGSGSHLARGRNEGSVDSTGATSSVGHPSNSSTCSCSFLAAQQQMEPWHKASRLHRTAAIQPGRNGRDCGRGSEGSRPGRQAGPPLPPCMCQGADRGVWIIASADLRC